MVENPATWGKAERVVYEAMIKHEQDMEEGICGLSEIRAITDALRAAGLLKDV